jgi:monoamine oxidase
MMEVTARYKLKEGTGSLAAAIAAEVPEIQLQTAVAGVEQHPDGVMVTTEAGDRIRARAAIVTAPRNALRDIRFSPSLSEVKRDVIADGQASQGLKLWARLAGTYEPFFAYGEENSALGFASVEYHVDGDTIVVGFGADASRLDGNDADAVQRELTRWLPDVEVVGAASHDWVADRFSQQTWLTPRPGQFVHIEEMQRPEGRIHLAGGDYVRGGPSSIDGAIEGGLISARRAFEQLKGTPVVAAVT